MADIWTVLVAGVIGALGPLVVLIIQGRQNKETRKSEASEAKKESIRQQYANILEAAYTFVNLVPEIDVLSDLGEHGTLAMADGERLSVILEAALDNLDRARAILALDQSDIVTDELRKDMQTYKAEIARRFRYDIIRDINFLTERIATEVGQMKQTIRERVAKL